MKKQFLVVLVATIGTGDGVCSRMHGRGYEYHKSLTRDVDFNPNSGSRQNISFGI